MSAPVTTGRRSATGLVWALRLVGAALLAAMGWIHLDLWLAGYRDIDMIGPAFLLNAIAGFGLAALLLLTPRPLLHWVAALGALTALGTLGGLLLATTVGLFGFVESTAADRWWASLWVEVAAIVVLGALAGLAARRRS
jgi:hypothetical protein